MNSSSCQGNSSSPLLAPHDDTSAFSCAKAGSQNWAGAWHQCKITCITQPSCQPLLQPPLISSSPSTSCVGLCATNSNSGIASALLRPYSDTLHGSRGRSVCFCRAAVPQSTAWWASNSLAAVSVCWHTAIPCSIRMLQQCTIVQKTIAQSPSTLQSNKPC